MDAARRSTNSVHQPANSTEPSVPRQKQPHRVNNKQAKPRLCFRLPYHRRHFPSSPTPDYSPSRDWQLSPDSFSPPPAPQLQYGLVYFPHRHPCPRYYANCRHRTSPRCLQTCVRSADAPHAPLVPGFSLELKGRRGPPLLRASIQVGLCVARVEEQIGDGPAREGFEAAGEQWAEGTSSVSREHMSVWLRSAAMERKQKTRLHGKYDTGGNTNRRRSGEKEEDSIPDHMGDQSSKLVRHTKEMRIRITSHDAYYYMYHTPCRMAQGMYVHKG